MSRANSLRTWVTFCDDVREEINGKISLIGIYGRKMFMSQFPCLYPKLFVVVDAEISSIETLHDFSLAMHVPGSPPHQMPIDVETLRNAPNQAQPFQFRVIFSAIPLEFQNPGPIIVSSKFGKKIQEIGRLEIEQKPENH